MMTHSIRIWDEVTSDTMLVDDAGRVYNERGQVIAQSGARKYAAEAAWGVIVNDGSLADAGHAAAAEWAEGYEGDPRNIRAEVTAL